MMFISVILKGSVTCKKPLGSFSLITSRQYSISPVVCLNFTVQWDIWSRTTWDKRRKKEKENESMICPVAGLLGNSRTNCHHSLQQATHQWPFTKNTILKCICTSYLRIPLVEMCVWVCPSFFYLNLQATSPLHDVHVHTDAHTRPPEPILQHQNESHIKHFIYEAKEPFKSNQNQTELKKCSLILQSHWTKLEPQHLCNHGNKPEAPWRQEERIGLHKM